MRNSDSVNLITICCQTWYFRFLGMRPSLELDQTIRPQITFSKGVRLVGYVVKEPVPVSNPGKGVTEDAGEGTTDEGAVAAGLLVGHAHEKVDVLNVRVGFLQSCNALMSERKI
jgi:hypothetical protein